MLELSRMKRSTIGKISIYSVLYILFLIIFTDIYLFYFFPVTPPISQAPTRPLAPIPTIIPAPTIIIPRAIITKTPTVKPITSSGNNDPWGVAKQIDEHTWTMKIGEDSTMALPQEILIALNEYRKVYGSQKLGWDEKLAHYAQSRADYLYSIKGVDQHKGFSNFLDNEDGFNKLGFTWLGENISYGYRLNGVHLIEWIYAGDEPHNKNQLDSKWSSAGIGVKGTATCLIFATGKM